MVYGITWIQRGSSSEASGGAVAEVSEVLNMAYLLI